MSKIAVEYITHMGTDVDVANIARVSFDKWKDEAHPDEQDKRLISYLAKHEHTSPFRHPQVMLRCHTPIFIARQLGKHQAGFSWNEVSRRYVDEGITFYDMGELRARPEGGIKQGSAGVHPHNEMLMDTFEKVQQSCLDCYNMMIEVGVAPEQARAILPQNMMTSWVWTGSLYGWYHLYRLRVDGHAQVEAQIFAEEIDHIMTNLFPVAWQALKDSKE